MKDFAAQIAESMLAQELQCIVVRPIGSFQTFPFWNDVAKSNHDVKMRGTRKRTALGDASS